MPRHLPEPLVDHPALVPGVLVPGAVAPSSDEAPPLPSGWEALDRLLGGGWPGGVLTEVIGHGRCSLALAAVRQAQAAGQPVAWVDGPGTFCPPSAGVDLLRLALVRPPRAPIEPATTPLGAHAGARNGAPAGARADARCWLAGDLLLRSRAFGLLVLDLPPCRPSLAVCFRLARQAAAARTVLLLLSASQGGVAGSAAGVLVHVRQQHPGWQRRTLPPPPALELTLRRHRGGASGACIVL